MPEFLIELLGPTALGYAVLGFVVGAIGGAIPGINIVLTMTLLIPFTFNLTPTQTVILLISCYVGGEYSGSIPAILINTPGTPSSAAVVLDGYPMAKQGLGARAIGISATASGVGNLIGGLFLLAVAPVLAQVVLTFGSPEFFLLAVLGLATIVSTVDGSLRQAGIAAALGALIATVGVSTLSANPRFTFDSPYLYDGISLTPAFIGIFAIAEMLRLAAQRESITSTLLSASGSSRHGFTDAMRHWRSMLRGSAIGIFVGAIPGQGGAVANFLSYTAEQQSSREPERFGKGHPAGIAGPEAANNSVIGAALVPTIGLGIPGSGSTAVILTALLLQGVRPGPQLFVEDLVLVQVIIGTVLVGGILTFLFGFGLARPLALLSRIPLSILIPVVTCLSLVGVYAEELSPVTIGSAVVLGFVGFALVRFGYSPVAFVLGLILGPIAEENLARVVQLSGGAPWLEFVTRPVSVIIIALIVLVLVRPSLRRRTLRKRQAVG
jgi:putative tricarboxylic transport membrane protein